MKTERVHHNFLCKSGEKEGEEISAKTSAKERSWNETWICKEKNCNEEAIRQKHSWMQQDLIFLSP